MIFKHCINAILVLLVFMCTTFATTSSSKTLQINFQKTTIRDMVCDKNNNLWIGTFGIGLWKVSGNVITNVYDEKSQQPYSMINKLDLVDNHLWISTAGNGCSALNIDTEKFDIVPKVNGFDRLHAFLVTSNKKTIIGSVGSGSAILEKNCWKAINDDPPMSRKWVNCFSEWQGKLWIGTSIDLFSLDLDKIKIKWRPKHQSIHNGVNCLTSAGDKIYIGTTRDGIYFIDSNLKKHNVPNTYGSIYKILLWKNSYWAIGEAGLWSFSNNKSSLVSQYKFSTPKSVMVDSSGNLIIGTINGKIILTENGKDFSPIFEFDHNKLERIKK